MRRFLLLTILTLSVVLCSRPLQAQTSYTGRFSQRFVPEMTSRYIWQFMDGKYQWMDTVHAPTELGYSLRFGVIPLFNLPSIFEVIFDRDGHATSATWTYWGTQTADIIRGIKVLPAATLADYTMLVRKLEAIHGKGHSVTEKGSKATVWEHSNTSVTLYYDKKTVGLTVFHYEPTGPRLTQDNFEYDFKYVTEARAQ